MVPTSRVSDNSNFSKSSGVLMKLTGDVGRDQIRRLEGLSPFELEGYLNQIASKQERGSAAAMLNAGRGNPNFVATTPREAFFRLGLFALEECRRAHEWDSEMAHSPALEGAGARFRRWLEAHDGESGVDLLRRTLDYGVCELSFDEDEFTWELVDSIIGDHYPTPPRMLEYNEAITRRYLVREMGVQTAGRDDHYDVFATEGGAAAMTYLFNTLKANWLLSRGDRVAMMTPIFTPYLEIAGLPDFAFDTVHIDASARTERGLQTWQFSDTEIDKLRDPAVKLLFCVNPTNPPSVRIADATLDRIAKIVATDKRDLMIVTDDVYATFIDGFRSLMAVLPRNTATVYSFSKFFGATGWRLGAIAVHSDNVFDRLLGRLPEEALTELDARYKGLTLEPRKLKFIDRLLADSRNVALAHAAGLSLPQQCQQLLFCAYCLLDGDDHYKRVAQRIVNDRLKTLLDGMQVTIPDDPNRVGYYIELDFLDWGERKFGKGFAAFLQERYEPEDLLFRLAEKTSVVLLPGLGFAGPPWSVRVSLANLTDADYERIGRGMMQISEEYVAEWKKARTAAS
jgi:aspartate 4-decarboxylase